MVYTLGKAELRIQQVEAVSVVPYTALGFSVDEIETEMSRLRAAGDVGWRAR